MKVIGGMFPLEKPGTGDNGYLASLGSRWRSRVQVITDILPLLVGMQNYTCPGAVRFMPALRI